MITARDAHFDFKFGLSRRSEIFQREAPYFCEHFLPILTLKLGNLTLFGKFCAIEVACKFEDFPIFCVNPPYFLDGNVGISG